MPVSPYARALVSVNGAGNTSGGIDIPSACTIALTGESTVGWTQQIWEFIDFPEGWATPAGWTLGADGTIYSTDVVPTTITMPANTTLWGSWALRLRINQQVSSSADLRIGLVDKATRFDMASPKGQRDIGALEEGQFCTPTTDIKQWVRSYQRNIRVLETLAGGGWTTALDLDFTAASTRNLDAAGNYVIGGKTWKSAPNTFGAGSIDLVNGTGLVFATDTFGSDYGPFMGSDGAVKNTPFIWLPLSQLAIPNLDWTTQFRIWLSCSNQTITGGASAADGVVWGIDTGVDNNAVALTNWYALVGGRAASSATQPQLRAGIGFGTWSAIAPPADVTGLSTYDPTKIGTTRLDLKSLLPDSTPTVHFGPGYTGGAWPTKLVPWVAEPPGSAQHGRSGSQIGWANDYATPAEIGDRLGIVIAMANYDAFTHPDTATITRLRVDYKL